MGVCGIYEGVNTAQSGQQQSGRVRRLATMFTMSNELMSLMEELSEAASFHCVSQPEWVYESN